MVEAGSSTYGWSKWMEPKLIKGRTGRNLENTGLGIQSLKRYNSYPYTLQVARNLNAGKSPDKEGKVLWKHTGRGIQPHLGDQGRLDL